MKQLIIRKQRDKSPNKLFQSKYTVLQYLLSNIQTIVRERERNSNMRLLKHYEATSCTSGVKEIASRRRL